MAKFESDYDLEEQGHINPETNTPWFVPDLALAWEGFKPRYVYTDLPPGWNDPDDESWFQRHWPKDLDAEKLFDPEIAQVLSTTIPNNIQLYEHLCNYWLSRRHEFDLVQNNVWAKSTFLQDSIRMLDSTLGEKNYHLAHILFSNIHSSPLCEGMQQGYQAEFWLRNFQVMLPKYKKLIVDRIVSLAEYVGGISVQSPEQGGHPFYFNINEIIESTGTQVNRISGKKLGFPVYQGGLIGIKTIAGIIDERQVNSLYIALKIHEKLKDNPEAKICDLGAGNGLVLFWLYQLGYKNLYAVDLPHISLLQIYNLSIHFGIDHVGTGLDCQKPIKICSMEEFAQTNYDLVVNSDSLPEIDHDWAETYLKHISSNSKYFYSINQETMHKEQLNISLTMQKKYHNMQRLSRDRFWMRPGYIEEWYLAK